MKKIFIFCLAAFSLCYTPAQSPYLDVLSRLYDPALKPFYYGVASGDPTAEGVVIWTKLSPGNTQSAARVRWELAEDSLFQRPVKQGVANTNAETDWTLAVDVQGLEAGRYYYYRFEHQGDFSITGRTKTAAAGPVDKLRFAVVSCANYEAGYYNAYAAIARRNDLDAVLHLGDYIYEYGTGTYGNKKLLRRHIPDKEIIRIEDYRARYAQYRLDPDLRQAHARHPFICIWDDHEIANDAYKDGAQNHQPDTDGDWETRKAAARQAYFEWIPLRRDAAGQLYRQLSFGDMASLWMLDERLEGRSPQAKEGGSPDYRNPERHMLGPEQLAWLTSGMERSPARWRLIGNQVIMSSLDASKALPKNPKFMDMWDGYPAERERLLGFCQSHDMRNVIVLSGDSHTSWGIELTLAPQDKTRYDPKTGKGVIGAEFAAPSISSANLDEYMARWKAWVGERIFMGRLNPHVRFVDVVNHGYLELKLLPDAAEAQWHFMKRIDRPGQLKEKRGARARYVAETGKVIKKR